MRMSKFLSQVSILAGPGRNESLMVSEPRAVATGPSVAWPVSIKGSCSIRSLPLAVLTRLVAQHVSSVTSERRGIRGEFYVQTSRLLLDLDRWLRRRAESGSSGIRSEFAGLEWLTGSFPRAPGRRC